MAGGSTTDVTRALERWLAALQGFGALGVAQQALADDAVVERLGWDSGRGLVRERFEGHAAIAAWCGRSPREVEFGLAGPPEPVPAEGPARWRVRYTVRLGDFESGGTWQLALAADGRIAALSHQPDDLPAAWRDGIPEGKVLPGFMPEDFERARAQALAEAERLRRAGLPPQALQHDHDHGHEE